MYYSPNTRRIREESEKIGPKFKTIFGIIMRKKERRGDVKSCVEAENCSANVI